MGKMTYNQGEQHMLRSYFQNEPESFGPFYIGLGSGPAPMVESSTLANLTEVGGDGYARVQVTRDATATGWTLAGNTVVSPVLSYSNTDPVNDWPPIDYVFLTLAASGTNGPLIAAVDLKNSVYLTPGQTAEVIFRFKTTTTIGDENRFVNMAAAAGGAGLVTATLTVI